MAKTYLAPAAFDREMCSYNQDLFVQAPWMEEATLHDLDVMAPYGNDGWLEE